MINNKSEKILDASAAGEKLHYLPVTEYEAGLIDGVLSAAGLGSVWSLIRHRISPQATAKKEKRNDNE